MTELSIPQRRQAAVQALMQSADRRLRASGVSRASLAEVGRELEEFVARHEDLFSEASFPSPGPGEQGVNYLVQTDPDSQMTLYLNAIVPGLQTPPHNHMTWAVIVAQDGEELNRIYRRVDDGADAQRAELALEREFTVRRQAGIQFLPEDIHSIHVPGGQGVRHFHLYGKPLDQLGERLGFNLQTGEITRFNARHLPQPRRAVDAER